MRKVLVIGSSPLMMITAIKLANSGNEVTLIDANSRHGGMWKGRVVNGVEIDQACHLFESYPGAYKTLEHYSGVKFVPRNPQPKRIKTDGKTALYYPRLKIFGEIVNRLSNLSRIIIHQIVGERNWLQITHPNLSGELTFIKLLFFRITTGFKVRHPQGGCVAFIKGLIDSCCASGVEMKTDQVMSVSDKDNEKLLVLLKSNQTLVFDEVHASASTICNIHFSPPKLSEEKVAEIESLKSNLINLQEEFQELKLQVSGPLDNLQIRDGGCHESKDMARSNEIVHRLQGLFGQVSEIQKVSGLDIIMKNPPYRTQYYGLYEVNGKNPPSSIYDAFDQEFSPGMRVEDLLLDLRRISVMDSDLAKEFFFKTGKILFCIHFAKPIKSRLDRISIITDALKDHKLFEEGELIRELGYNSPSYYTSPKLSLLQKHLSTANFRVISTIGDTTGALFKEEYVHGEYAVDRMDHLIW